MKKLLFPLLIICLLSSCNKSEETVNNKVLPPSVEMFTGSYLGSVIDLNWNYGYTSQIKGYLLYQYPGSKTDTISPNIQYYRVFNPILDTNYLFNIRVIDKMNNLSEAAVVRVSTHQ